MIDKNRAIKYCKNDISLIENYDKAIADKTQVWHCHHRRETIFSKSDLIEIGEYYNRPACELIFLTKSEHTRLHQLGKNVAEETCEKMSEAHKGKHHSEETRKKMSESRNGKHHSEETRKKMSESRKGKSISAETRKKMSESNKGKPSWMKDKHHSAEAKKKMGEAHKGKHWYNNGVTSIQTKTCPEGFVPGRLK